MGNRVVHFEIVGKDAIRLQKFYSELFDWKIAEPSGPETGFYGLVDEATSGLPGGIGQEPGGGSRVTVYVGVPDLQAALDKAVSLGGQVAMTPTEIPGTGVTMAYFLDPDGNGVGLLKV